MNISLRPYQQKFISDISEAMTLYKHCLCQAATGFGKTICFSYLAKKTSEKGNKILILSNRCELLTQTGGSLSSIGVNAEYISPKHKKVPVGKVVIAMAQTLRRRYELAGWSEYLNSVDLLIIDEAHFGDFTFIHESGIFREKWVLGFTATPEARAKQRQLGLDYDCIVLGARTKELIDSGYLVLGRYFTLDAPDLTKVDVDPKDGDYKSTQLHAVYDTPSRYGGVISEYNKISPHTSSLCFCASQIHTIQTCMEFNKNGISAKYLVSGFGKDEDGYNLWKSTQDFTGKRDVIISDFKNGDFLILVNNGILVAGFDAPCVRTIILNMATLSRVKYLQILGRGSRVFPGKNHFKVLDFGGNVERFGLYETDRKWSLWHPESSGSGIQPLKVCPKEKKDKNGKTGCGRLIPTFYKECPFCEYLFATEKEIRDIELTEIIGGKLQFRDMNAQELGAYAELHGYARTWAFRQLWIGGGEKGFKKGMKSLGYEWGYIYRLLKSYEKTI